MSIIKVQIPFNSQNTKVTIPINANDAFYGHQQGIDNLTEITGNDLINPPVDGEKRRFAPEMDTTLYFYFLNNSDVYGVDFNRAGFTSGEISNSLSFLNSFFIFDFFDTINVKTQRKIFTTYLTKLGNLPTYNLYTSINQSNQQYSTDLNYLYVPEWFIQQSTSTNIVGYGKFSFYKAKKELLNTDKSKIKPFFNNENTADTTSLKLYFPINLDLVTRKWKFLTIYPNNIKIYEMKNASIYKSKIDNTFTNFDNIKQNFPTGNAFVGDGTYSTE